MSFLNLNRSRLATLFLSLSLTAAPALAQDAQRAVLSGRTGMLAWTFYGPGALGNLSADAKTTLRLSAPAGSTVIGSKYDNGSAVLAFRTAADTTLQNVYQFHDSQLTRQGFTRTSQSISGNTANASYTRGNEQVMLMLTQNNPGSYRATLDLTAMQNMAMQNTTAASSPIAQAATNTTNTNTATPTVNLQNQTGNNPVITANDLAGVQYMLYGAGGNLGSLSSDPGTASFSVPQGATITNTNINGDGTLNANVTSGLSLQQMMDFYDKQFKAQGFTLVNPTDTGAGGDNALTYIYERPSSKSRVSFNVAKRGVNDYLLIWDFQQYTANANAAATPVVTPTAAPTPTSQMAPASTASQTDLQNQSGSNAVIGANDQAGVQYMLYGPNSNMNLTNNAKMVSFTVPQGATITNGNVNGNGDLSAQVTSTLTLQQMMDFYDKQFKAQGFTLVNPTDTGAGGDNALTYIYERASSNSRVSFSVDKQDNYLLIWDFQDYAAFNRTGNATATAGLAPYGSPLYGYDYNNTRYDFYGASPTDTSVNTLTPNAQRVIIAAPPAATNVQTPVQNGQQVQVSFNSNMTLQQVFDFYDNQFTRQTFAQASGQLSQNATQIAARYDRGTANSVRVSVMQQGNTQYMVMMDFTPQQ